MGPLVLRWMHAAVALIAATVAVTFATSALAKTVTSLGASCHADSGPRTVALVELYTSEGCSSCPPADRWLSRHFAPTAGGDAVALAFHVDYWDRLGWKDRFATAAYTERQYDSMRMNRARFVYTPQVLVGGREFGDWRTGPPERAIAAINARPPRARIALDVTVSNATLSIAAQAHVDAATDARRASLAVALVDNGLVSDIKAGENSGARLSHDHVVRHFASGLSVATRSALEWPLPKEAGSEPAVVAFVQDTASGEVLQALALPLAACASDR